MRPHEEELHVERFSLAEDSPNCLVSKSDNCLVACFRGGNTKDWEALFQAAPDMARALLEHCEACDSCHGTGVLMVCDMEIHTPVACPGCSDDRAVLRKAGVL